MAQSENAQRMWPENHNMTSSRIGPGTFMIYVFRPEPTDMNNEHTQKQAQLISDISMPDINDRVSSQRIVSILSVFCVPFDF